MRKILKSILSCSVVFLLNGCGTYFNQPLGPSEARTGEKSPATNALLELPDPAERVPVGVYNFKDLTGQFKASSSASTFSTAVTQGSTSILIKALEDSNWFLPLERENLNNLLQERSIIKSTRDEARRTINPNEPRLPGLLFAGILLEGGIVSYDTNIVTGGMGARYFGIGSSSQYRQDRVTVYLRAISTSSGEILNTVYVSKTILSQSVDASLFKYVNFQRLLEVETGFTKNEPVQLAVKEALEKAVRGLIIEGLQKRLWSTSKGTELNQSLIDEYVEDKNFEETVRLYDRVYEENPAKSNFDFYFGSTVLDGDLGNKDFGLMASVGYTKKLIPNLNLNINGKYLQLRSSNVFDEKYFSTDMNLEVDILPYDNFKPFIYAGGGYIFGETISSAKVQYGLGVNYKLSNALGIKIFAEQNVTFTDELEFVQSGKRDDFYYNLGFGIRYSLGSRSKKIEDEPELIEE